MKKFRVNLLRVNGQRLAYYSGIAVQGLVLGLLLTFALVGLWAESDNVRLFRYQNF